MFSFQGASFECRIHNAKCFLHSVSSFFFKRLIETSKFLLTFQSISSFCILHFASCILKWWAKMDSNHRPHDYQSCALASWAIGPYLSLLLVESTGIEPVTSCLQGRRSPSWANPPYPWDPLFSILAVPSKLNNATVWTFHTLVLTYRTLQARSSSYLKSP